MTWYFVSWSWDYDNTIVNFHSFLTFEVHMKFNLFLIPFQIFYKIVFISLSNFFILFDSYKGEKILCSSGGEKSIDSFI